MTNHRRDRGDHRRGGAGSVPADRPALTSCVRVGCLSVPGAETPLPAPRIWDTRRPWQRVADATRTYRGLGTGPLPRPVHCPTEPGDGVTQHRSILPFLGPAPTVSSGTTLRRGGRVGGYLGSEGAAGTTNRGRGDVEPRKTPPRVGSSRVTALRQCAWDPKVGQGHSTTTPIFPGAPGPQDRRGSSRTTLNPTSAVGLSRPLSSLLGRDSSPVRGRTGQGRRRQDPSRYSSTQPRRLGGDEADVATLWVGVEWCPGVWRLPQSPGGYRSLGLPSGRRWGV